MLLLSEGAWVGTLLTRVLWRGLLLRTAWASNSCDKCSSHGDGGRFSQTNNSRMFICGSPHLGRSACLPLSLDTGIGVCVCVSLTALLRSFWLFLSGLFVFSPPFPCLTSLTCFWFTHLSTMLKRTMHSVLKELRLSQHHLLCSTFPV